MIRLLFSQGITLLCLCAMGAGWLISRDATADDDVWIQLFDGESFDGWRANENVDTWTIRDGAFVCDGPRSHLFYVGDEAPFKNFELKIDVMTEPGSNAGIYFHTRYQEEGWPRYGYESQVNNTHRDPRKTGSLYAVSDVDESAASDNEWWTQHIIVNGRRIIVKIDGETVVDYTEPEGQEPGEDFTRVLDEGTFALQGHDPQSVVYFKNIRVRRLPD